MGDGRNYGRWDTHLTFDDRTSGPINAIWFDWKHGYVFGVAAAIMEMIME
jgi:hypothetical protein